MKHTFLFKLFVIAALLCIVACEKDDSGSHVPIQEGYLAQTSFLNIKGIRFGDLSAENLVPVEGLTSDSNVELTKVQLGVRQVLSPGGYTNLEIDFAASGSDACYVKSPITTSDALSSPSGPIHTLDADGSFLVDNGTTTKQVLLLDLNRYVTNGEEGRVDFSFRENISPESPRMQLYDVKSVGKIKGQLVRTEASPRQTHRLITYAYKMGSFRLNEEIKNEFSSAFISSIINRNDQFSFPILPEGAYELIVAHYVDADQDGVLEFKELLQADADVRSNVRLARVSANASTTIDLKLGGIIED